MGRSKIDPSLRRALITVSVAPAVKSALEQRCEANGWRLSTYVDSLLSQAVERVTTSIQVGSLTNGCTFLLGGVAGKVMLSTEKWVHTVLGGLPVTLPVGVVVEVEVKDNQK